VLALLCAGMYGVRMTRIALYSGSFDPPTNGHVDVLAKSLQLADKVVIAIGVHVVKKALFSFDERLEMLDEISASLGDDVRSKVTVVAFDDLVVDAARRHGASMIVRGLRNASDFDYEMQMAGMNGEMAGDIPTVFVPASPGVGHITATLVRQITAMKGDITGFVPPSVAKRLAGKYPA